MERTFWCGLLLGLTWAFIWPDPARAQSISGYVRGGDGAPLPGASVRIEALERSTVTDGTGRYHLGDLPPEIIAVVFSYIGYGRVERGVDLRQGNVVLDVTLQEEVEVLEEVTVTGSRVQDALTRSAQSVAVLDAQALADRRGQTLGESLEHLPGVTTLSTGPSLQKPVIRGLHSDRVLVVNRGLPLEGQQWGAEHAPEIDPFAPARIEVVRGAAGVEYGVGAIGGIVRIESEALPTRPGLGGRLMFNAFSNSRQPAGSLELEGSPAAVPGLGVRLHGSVRRAGDARTPDYVLGNTAFYERSGELAAGYLRGPLEMEVHLSRFATDLGIYRGSQFNTFSALDTVLALGRPPVDYEFSYSIGAPKQVVEHDVAILAARYALGRGARLSVQYGLQNNRRREYDAHRLGGRDPLARPAFDLTLATHTLDARLQTHPRALWSGSAFAVVGLNGINQGNRSTIGYLIPNFRAYTAAGFARATWIRGPLTLEAGSRVDSRWLTAFPREAGDRGDFVRTKLGWTGVSGVVSAVWLLSRRWSVAATASSAWRPPSVNELYSYGVHHGTSQFEQGDPTLGREFSLGFDATLRHQSRTVEMEMSLYNTTINDYIFLNPTGEILTTIRGVFPEFRYGQTDAVLTGFDGSFQVNVTDWLVLGLTSAVVRGTDSIGRQPLLSMPADRAGLAAVYRFSDKGSFHGWEAELGASMVRRQDRFPTRTDENGTAIAVDYVPPPSGYAIFRAVVRGDLLFGSTPVRVSLAAENLLDTAYRDYLSRYRYFAHDPGRNVILRLEIPLGSS